MSSRFDLSGAYLVLGCNTICPQIRRYNGLFNPPMDYGWDGKGIGFGLGSASCFVQPSPSAPLSQSATEFTMPNNAVRLELAASAWSVTAVAETPFGASNTGGPWQKLASNFKNDAGTLARINGKVLDYTGPSVIDYIGPHWPVYFGRGLGASANVVPIGQTSIDTSRFNNLQISYFFGTKEGMIVHPLDAANVAQWEALSGDRYPVSLNLPLPSSAWAVDLTVENAYCGFNPTTGNVETARGMCVYLNTLDPITPARCIRLKGHNMRS